MTFTQTWNSTFETLPADSEVASQGASRIRNLKEAVSERLSVDHVFGGTGDVDSGKHNKVTLLEQSANPSSAANTGFIYTKDVGGVTELFYEDSAGNVKQITNAGSLNIVTASAGDIKMWPTASAPSLWLKCDGSAISRSTYSALFAVISTTFGVGNGSTTFNLPNFNGRMPIGIGQGDTADGGGTGTSRTLADIGGAETHTLTTGEVPALNTTLYGDSPGAFPGVGQIFSSRGAPSITLTTNGGGGSHSIMNPFLAINFVIYAGV